MSTQALLRLTVAALMTQTGERQTDLAAGIGQTQAQVSRKLKGVRPWSLDDVDLLAAHYGMPPLDLLAGPTHAAEKLALSQHAGSARQTTRPAPQPAPAPAPAGSPAPLTPPAPPTAAAPLPAAREATSPDPAPPEPPAAAPPEPPAAAPPTVAPRRRTAPSAPLADEIRATITRTLTEHHGDLDAAGAALIKSAIPDVMALFQFSRVGGRYEHTEFPPTADLLKKKSQKGADEVWEGRPKWRATELHRAAGAGLMRLDVTALDMNAAYLAALKTHLPIGRLVPSAGDEAALDPRRSGIHRVTPPEWTTPDLPSPLGARKVPGDLWIAEPTLRLLLDCAKKGLCEAPVIHESLTSGSTEGLLEKLRRALVEVRKEALAKDDELTTEYVKSMYSKFVSTIGESSANRQIRRPDWMHIIRAQAFSNLWRKAQKAHTSGLTVVEMSGTDELHVAGDWRQVFEEGRDLAQVKPKRTYTLGGDQ